MTEPRPLSRPVPRPAANGRCPRSASTPDGRVRIDYRAIAALALPLMVNSSLQAVINLTDTWFVGHISTTAMAGMAAIFWLVFFFVMLVGGIGLGVQTFVAQYEGSGRRWRAGHATWVGLWGARGDAAVVRAARLVRRRAAAALRPRSGGRGACARVLVAAHARRAARRGAVGASSGSSTASSRPRVTVMTTAHRRAS